MYLLFPFIIQVRDARHLEQRLYTTAEYHRICRFSKTSIWGRLVFSWTTEIIELANKIKSLDLQDLDLLPEKDRVLTTSQRFLQKWREQKSDERSLVMTLIKSFGRTYFSLGILRFMVDALTFSGPVLLGQIVTFISSSNNQDQYGYMLAALLFLFTAAAATLQSQYDFWTDRISLWVVFSICLLILRIEIGEKRYCDFSLFQIALYKFESQISL